jgi:carotenoid cleavage dioxygenase-like enzyme
VNVWSAFFRSSRSLLLAPLLACGLAAEPQDRDLPPEFQQILPRGRIASIDNPGFVPADEAKISDDAWIFGVVIDGEARAYSLTLLNSHEVVNDRIGDLHFAAVW